MLLTIYYRLRATNDFLWQLKMGNIYSNINLKKNTDAKILVLRPSLLNPVSEKPRPKKIPFTSAHYSIGMCKNKTGQFKNNETEKNSFINLCHVTEALEEC